MGCKKSDHVSCLFHSQLNITVDVSYQFFDALQASSLVIGLAGTANEQAMFAKRPLISFVGEGPQSTKQRFLQQHQLIDGARCLFIDSKDPFTISTEISNYISNETFEWTSLNDCYQDAASKIRDCICHSLIQPS